MSEDTRQRGTPPSQSGAAIDPALERLIDETIRSMGDVDPHVLPHLLRERLAGQLAGTLDLEAYLKRKLHHKSE